MSKSLVYRQNRMFKLEESELPVKARTIQSKNALYAAIYTEFTDAQYNPKYESMNILQRMQAVEAFARKWLKDGGFV